MPRRYCGCSLHLLVTFEGHAQPDELLVCARFETTSEDAAIPCGRVVQLPASLFELAGQEDGMWVRGDRESVAKQRQAPEVRPCSCQRTFSASW